ncbi:MAG: hypothetical protein U0441_16925 [Polyangiaceae bacterium]
MSKLTIAYGTVLGALGVGGYLSTGRQSKTALIPAGFGAAEIALGVLAKVPLHRTVALTGAAAVAVGAFAGSARGLKKLPALLRGEPVERPAAVIAQSAMAALSLGYLAALGLSARK